MRDTLQCPFILNVMQMVLGHLIVQIVHVSFKVKLKEHKKRHETIVDVKRQTNRIYKTKTETLKKKSKYSREL